MMNRFIDHVAKDTGLTSDLAQAALGVVLNAADRQGAEIAELVFTKVPGARTLAASSGASIGAATGMIARMIERTPGGQAEVASQMVRDLQKTGLGHAQISAIFPSIADFARKSLGYTSDGHIGDFVGVKRALATQAA